MGKRGKRHQGDPDVHHESGLSISIPAVDEKFLLFLEMLFSVMLITLFLLICDIRVGLFFVFAFGGILVLAYGLRYLTARRIRIRQEIVNGMGAKGEKLTCRVLLTNRLPFFSAPITFDYAWGNVWETEGAEEPFCLKPFEKQSFLLSCTIPEAGNIPCGIDGVNVCDFFRLFEEIRVPVSEHLSFRVLPELDERPQADRNLEELLESAVKNASGDNDVQISPRAGMNNGYPGVEARPYQPGDSLKKVHSKLSARTDELMIRIDEPRVTMGAQILLLGALPTLGKKMPGLLGFFQEKAVEEEYPLRTALLERTLRLCALFLSKDQAADVIFPVCREKDCEWVSVNVREPSDLAVLQEALSGFRGDDYVTGKAFDPASGLNLLSSGALLVLAISAKQPGLETLRDYISKTGISADVYFESTGERGQLP